MDIESVGVIHFIPGRIRLRMEEIKGSPEDAEWVRSILGEVPGVRIVEVSPVTGSILLTYDRGTILTKEAADSLGQALRTLFPDLDVARLLIWLVSLTNGPGSRRVGRKRGE